MEFLKFSFILLMFTGCNAFDADIEKCDLPCGPCELGRWNCDLDSCDLGQLSDVLTENDTCNDVSFVSKTNEGPKRGTRAEPFTSIATALEVDTKVIIVSTGQFNEPVILRRDVSVIGGFDSSDEIWSPTTELTSIVAPSGFSPLDASNAKRINVKNFAFLTESSVLQIGAQITDVDDVSIENSTFNFESAPDGKNGDDGIDGENGGDGGRAEERDGGSGGVNLVCGQANGGKGGKGAFQNNQEVGDAEAGQASPLGAIGGSIGENGKNGAKGNGGNTGESGQWDVENGQFVVNAPTNGIDGSPGQGGSGGGGSTDLRGSFAYSGGGGGAGGCGGSGGKAGENGGFIIGITVFNANLLLNSVAINLKDGGAGSTGGNGGAGGDGGAKGKGGFGVVQDGQAANGGAGGIGGMGGNGGDGIDGFSLGVACFGEKTNLKQENLSIKGETNEKNNLPNCG